jgi:hypothetical protein
MRNLVRLVWIGLATMCVVVGQASAAGPSPAPADRIVFEAEYEAPFERVPLKPQHSHLDPIGSLIFRVWDNGEATYLTSRLTYARPCNAKGAYVCVGGLMTFAAPMPGVSSWSWQNGDDEFYSLVSRQLTSFRGKLIETVLIRRDNLKFQTEYAFFVYSYEVGLIAY